MKQELIDRNKLYETAAAWESRAYQRLWGIKDRDSDEWHKWAAIATERGAFMRDIMEQPIVEAKKPHGKWVWALLTIYKDRHVCDQCNYMAPMTEIGCELLSDFCPNCGAAMEVPKIE